MKCRVEPKKREIEMMKGCTLRHYSGLRLEKSIDRFLEWNLELEGIEHNSYSPVRYPNEHAYTVDFIIKNQILLEATNPKEGTWFKDADIWEKVEYFKRKDPTHLKKWVMVTSYANFRKQIYEIMVKLGITVIILGVTATATNTKQIINRLYHSQLYPLLNRLYRQHPTIQYDITINTKLTNTNNAKYSTSNTNNKYYLYRIYHSRTSAFLEVSYISETVREIEFNGCSDKGKG